MAKKSKRSRRSKLHRTCGAMAAHMMLLERYPSYRVNQMRLEDATNRRRERPSNLRQAKIVTIKTVVNVVYKTARAERVDGADQQSDQRAQQGLSRDQPRQEPDARGLERPRDRLADQVQARENDPHQDDRERLHARRRREERRDRRNRALQSQDPSEHVGLSRSGTACSATHSSPAARRVPTASSSTISPSARPARPSPPSTRAAPRRTRSATT